MRLEDLNYVIEVNKQHSISRAAKMLYVTQPTISIAIQNMEEEFGVSLFTRSNKGVVLTENGEKAYKTIEKIVSLTNDLKELGKKNKLRNIKISAVPEVCNSMMINVTKKYQTNEDNVLLKINETRNTSLLSEIANQSIDIGIGCYLSLNENQTKQKIEESGFVLEEIIHDNLVAFISRKDSLSYQPYLTTKELNDRKPILFADNERINFNDNASFTVGNNFYSFSDKNSIKTAVAKGMGYAILPSIMGIDEIYVETGVLSVVPVADINVKLTTYIASRKNQNDSQINRLIEIIKQEANHYQNKINKNTENNNETVSESKNSIQIMY